MGLKLLECVVLKHDLPEHGLKKGDIGAVVEVYTPDEAEVEFVEESGDTRALLTLTTRDVRRARASELSSGTRA